MPAKGRALPGSCWWGWEGGCDPPCGMEMGMEAQGVTPQVPPRPPTKNQQPVGHPGPSPIFAVDASHEHRQAWVPLLPGTVTPGTTRSPSLLGLSPPSAGGHHPTDP